MNKVSTGNSLFLLVLFIVACNSMHEDIDYQKNIVAGIYDALGCDYTCCIDTLLDCEAYFSHSVSYEYCIDIHEDGNVDFRIRASSVGGLGGYSRSLQIISEGIENHTSVLDDSSVYVLSHQQGDTIDHTLAWSTNANNFLLVVNSGYDPQTEEPYYYVYGEWQDKYSGYVGFMNTSHRDTVYGWIQMDVFEDSKIFVKDFCTR